MATKTVPIDSIKISARIRKDLGNIQSLADNIKAIGLICPVVINQDNVLLAGERRLTACKSLGYSTIDAVIKNTADAEHELLIEIAENTHRKRMTREEIISAGIELERIDCIKAQERHKTSTGGCNPQLKENFPEADKGQVRDIVGRKLGMSGKQYEREKFILQNRDLLDDGDFAKWNNYEISTNKAYGLIKRNLPITNEAIASKSTRTAAVTPTTTSHAPEKSPLDIIKEMMPQLSEDERQDILNLYASDVEDNAVDDLVDADSDAEDYSWLPKPAPRSNESNNQSQSLNDSIAEFMTSNKIKILEDKNKLLQLELDKYKKETIRYKTMVNDVDGENASSVYDFCQTLLDFARDQIEPFKYNPALNAMINNPSMHNIFDQAINNVIDICQSLLIKSGTVDTIIDVID